MEDNIIKIGGRTIIMNGGNPLPGCPNDCDEAKQIEERLNDGLDEESILPKWSFDCGFKLNYDGPLLSVSSRFYPPKTHYGPTWDGNVRIYFKDEIIEQKAFDCTNLEELKAQVEGYVKTVEDRITAAFNLK